MRGSRYILIVLVFVLLGFLKLQNSPTQSAESPITEIPKPIGSESTASVVNCKEAPISQFMHKFSPKFGDSPKDYQRHRADAIKNYWRSCAVPSELPLLKCPPAKSVTSLEELSKLPEYSTVDASKVKTLATESQETFGKYFTRCIQGWGSWRFIPPPQFTWTARSIAQMARLVERNATRFLDAGSGCGNLMWTLFTEMSFSAYVALDYHGPSVAHSLTLRSKHRVMEIPSLQASVQSAILACESDIRMIHWVPSNFFDTVFSQYTLQYIPKEHVCPTLRHLLAKLKVKGLLVLSFPAENVIECLFNYDVEVTLVSSVVPVENTFADYPGLDYASDLPLIYIPKNLVIIVELLSRRMFSTSTMGASDFDLMTQQIEVSGIAVRFRTAGAADDQNTPTVDLWAPQKCCTAAMISNGISCQRARSSPQPTDRVELGVRCSLQRGMTTCSMAVDNFVSINCGCKKIRGKMDRRCTMEQDARWSQETHRRMRKIKKMRYHDEFF